MFHVWWVIAVPVSRHVSTFEIVWAVQDAQGTRKFAKRSRQSPKRPHRNFPYFQFFYQNSELVTIYCFFRLLWIPHNHTLKHIVGKSDVLFWGGFIGLKMLSISLFENGTFNAWLRRNGRITCNCLCSQ